jgi:hypothetical protein
LLFSGYQPELAAHLRNEVRKTGFVFQSWDFLEISPLVALATVGLLLYGNFCSSLFGRSLGVVRHNLSAAILWPQEIAAFSLWVDTAPFANATPGARHIGGDSFQASHHANLKALLDPAMQLPIDRDVILSRLVHDPLA